MIHNAKYELVEGIMKTPAFVLVMKHMPGVFVTILHLNKYIYVLINYLEGCLLS